MPAKQRKPPLQSFSAIPEEDVHRLVEARHHNPFSILGQHHAEAKSWQEKNWSLSVTLPPLAGLVLICDDSLEPERKQQL